MASRRCFIAMPITTPSEYAAEFADADHFGHVLEYLFVPAIVRAGFDPWPPKVTGPHIIHAEFTRALCFAEMVLVDLSGYNANVLFELGLRTGRDMPVALVRDDVTGPPPFDLIGWHCHEYRAGGMRPWSMEEQIAALAEHIAVAAGESAGHNSYWDAYGKPDRTRVDAHH
jgi:hypothetical protein